MENTNNGQLKETLIQYGKAITLITVLMCVNSVFATDSLGIQELQTQGDQVMNIIQFVAKWGGIFAIISAMILIGTGKAKGEMGTWLASLAIMIGGMAAAWGWFTTSFTKGFVW